MLDEIVTEGDKIGLKINEGKTKIMKLRNKTVNNETHIQIGQHTFEEVSKFKYLGIMMSNKGDRDTEIQEKIMAVNRALHANKKLLKSKDISKKIKMKIYKTVIRPVMLYAAETMTMTKKDEEDLRITERKIIRTILGPVKVTENEYRIRMNFEIEQELEGEDIIRKIKQQRAKWLGHVLLFILFLLTIYTKMEVYLGSV